MILDTKDMNKCYGCFACANICPKNCIELKHDDEGFFMPTVDRDVCIDCGLCDKVCIIDKIGKDFVNNKKKPYCYYGYSNDDMIRKSSASGGLAYTLSEKYINNDGVVYGVVGKWFEDVHHVRVENLDDLLAIRGSKNIQSRVGDSYRLVREDLDKGRKVFFTGTPCQIAGLYSYLNRKYDNLLTAEIVCHGVPSQKVLKSYIDDLEKKHQSKVVKFGRDETFQYYPVQYIAWFEDGSYEILMPENSIYRKGFLSNLYQRKSCINCMYSVLPRIADITMGDAMFNLPQKKEVIDPHNLGTSLILANTKNGINALKDIDDKFTINKCDLDRAINGNRWISHGIEENELRSTFFKVFLEHGFEKTYDIIETSYKIMNEHYIKENELYRKELLSNPILLLKRIYIKLRRIWSEKS